MGVLRFGSLWGIFPPNGGRNNKKRKPKRRNSSSSSSDSINLGREEFRFPYKQAATAASLTLTGDTIAQFRDKLSRWRQTSDDAESDGKVAFVFYLFIYLCILLSSCVSVGWMGLMSDDTDSLCATARVYGFDILLHFTQRKSWISCIPLQNFNVMSFPFKIKKISLHLPKRISQIIR